MATARSIWSGTISFGLVNIPVKLQSAVQSEELPLHMLAKKDMAPIKYARIDTKTGKEVDWKDIVKGYEYAKGKFVVVEDEDFEKASPQKSKSIDIVQFVKAEEIDPIYFEKPYYLLPAKGGEKTYRLLVKALEEAGTVGIAEFMLRNREHVCAIKPYKGLLLLDQMRYDEEIKEVPQQESGRVAEKELQLALKLIEQLTERFDPAAFKDDYTASLKKVIKAKAAGKHIRIAEPEERSATVKDLMEVLKQSLEGKGKKRA
ncbi:Ku protein [Flaviaesturariibacter aridisoli]|uniref:Non-homologous end joining protein Ku n=1 Tax=Flaviaesturariibacter aridisoli TaxID=2545761 RepID=A0A4R4E2F8_9BACT|nr:Ku protein [Flaviaesturariibacter aridisoli]TCZ69598.1 Ku protein [Flaviaesturariibacter aridisoli]